jgi:hypothetical protein
VSTYQSKSVSTPLFVIAAFKDCHELLASTRVSRNCVNSEWCSLWDNTGINQRTSEANETSGVAAWVGYTFALGQCFAL